MIPFIVAGALTLLSVSVESIAAEGVFETQQTGEPDVAACIDIPSDAFPSPEMAEHFAEYLAWTKAEGLSRLVAFERLPADQVHASSYLSIERRLPTPEMAEQFDAYLRWVKEQGHGRFHAFRVSQFD
jgi:hypothetical protein